MHPPGGSVCPGREESILPGRPSVRWKAVGPSRLGGLYPSWLGRSLRSNAGAPRDPPAGLPLLPSLPRRAEPHRAVPGKRRRSARCPASLRASTSRRHCVLFPARSTPSSAISAPRRAAITAPHGTERHGTAPPLPPRPPIAVRPAPHEYAAPPAVAAANGRRAGREYGMRPRALSCGPGGRRGAARGPQDGDCHVPGALSGQ